MTVNETQSLLAEQATEGTREILLLGGGAVVQQCFAPALVALGLQAKVTIVEPLEDLRLDKNFRSVKSDFRSFFASAETASFSHCVIALPNALHYEATTEALNRGFHVLSEKPLTLSRDGCERLAMLAGEQRLVLAVNMVRRLFRSVQIAAHVIRAGWLGDIQEVRISHGGAYAWPVRSLAPFDPVNGGVLADMGIHYLDLAEMLLGRLAPVVYRDDYAGGVESECQFELHTISHVPVQISLSRIHKLENEIHIAGSSGSLRMGVDDFDRCIFEDSSGGQIALGQVDGTPSSFADYFEHQIGKFLQASPTDYLGLADAHAAASSAGLLEWAYANRRTLQPARFGGSVRAKRLPSGPIYVTGATGFIGSHLVSRLQHDDVSPVLAAYHSLGSCARISRFPVGYHHTDLLDPQQVREAVRGKRYVFHLAYGRTDEDAHSINVQGTKNVVDAAIAEGVEAIVVLSTMYVLGFPGGTVDESHPYRPYGGSYGSTKAEMERWCIDRAKSSGKTRVVVLLPTCVWGPEGKTYTETPAALAQEGRFCWIANGDGVANVVFVENLIDSMILAALQPEAHGRRFIINDACLTWREFLTPLVEPWLDKISNPGLQEFFRLSAPPPGPGVGDVLKAAVFSREFYDTLSRTGLANQLRRPHIKKHLIKLVASFRRPQARKVESIPEPMAPPPWLPEVFGENASNFSSASANSVLGWKPRIAYADAMEQTVTWLSRKGLR